jgi:hypothetical protein
MLVAAPGLIGLALYGLEPALATYGGLSGVATAMLVFLAYTQLARLAAQVVREPFGKLPEPPKLVAMPGSVTGAVRKSWNVLGCLSAAAPSVMENKKMLDFETKDRVDVSNNCLKTTALFKKT